MDNQHTLIEGYRDLSQNEIDKMNAFKGLEAKLGSLLQSLDHSVEYEQLDPEAKRWVALARTHMEIGFMFAVKAVARPTNGLGRRVPEDS